MIGGEGYEPADDWAALFAAGVIAFNGVRLLRKAWREIMDASLPDRVVDDIREIARECRRRRRHRYVPRPQKWLGHVGRYSRRGPRRHDSTRQPRISHLVKDALLASDHNIMDAVVHIEPAKDSRRS